MRMRWTEFCILSYAKMKGNISDIIHNSSKLTKSAFLDIRTSVLSRSGHLTLKKDTHGRQHTISILPSSLNCLLVVFWIISQVSEVTMCAVTIMSSLFVYKSGVFVFCADELWISSLLRECALLSLVSSWVFPGCGERRLLPASQRLQPAQQEAHSAWETWMLCTGLQ